MNYFRLNVSGVKLSLRLLLSDCELIALTIDGFVLDVLTTLDAIDSADTLALCFENFGDVSFSVSF